MTSREKKNAGDSIEDIISEMLPLYSADADDRPQSLLGRHPKSGNIVKALQIFIDVMFPGKMSDAVVDAHSLPGFLRRNMQEGMRLLQTEIARALPLRWHGQAARKEGSGQEVDVEIESARVTTAFAQALPRVRWLLVEDVTAAYEGDPAALTYAEVQLAYPGLLAISSHRLAHELYKLQVPLVPRVMSEWTHAQTGADIHPGAQIGHGFFIDHATGVVIGETTIIGNRVKLYQGVTLGARSFTLDENGNPVKHVKRHPTVEDEVVIYANATILGGDTTIGRGSTIGGNVFLMKSVPAGSVVTNKDVDKHIKKRKEASTEEHFVHIADGI